MELIAHLNDKKDIQSLEDHCKNTFNGIQEDAKKRGLYHCMKLISLLHDAGKASQGFQEYIKKAALDGIKQAKVNHSSAGAQILLDRLKQHDGSNDILTKLMLAESIVSHHGLSDFFDVGGNNALYKRCYPDKKLDMENAANFINDLISPDEFTDLYEKANEELQKYIFDFIKMNRTKDCKDILFNIGALQRLMISLLIHGDREDTRNFMENTETIYYQENEIWKEASKKLECYIKEIEKSELEPKSEINKLRSSVSNQCKEFSGNPPGIFRLSCPTGSGKTLASLRYALNHAVSYNKKHIIYVAPYKTILEQNADVIRRFFSEDVVLEHHSNITPSDYPGYDYFSSSWNKPVILTTAVRLFDVLFKDRTTDVRRFHQLADSVLIIDEAQKISIRTVFMFNQMMNFLAYNCGATIVLCTATQPLLEKVDYPIRLSSNSEIVQQTKELHEQFKRVHIVDKCRNEKYSMLELADFIFQKLESGKSILAIVNTKAEALNLYHECLQHHELDNPFIYHLSTNMCPQHRNDTLTEMKEHILNKDTVLCVATNLIEAGVDIDCDIVIRSLCGLDSILQAAGRCNRNGKKSEMGTVYLINSKDENIGKLIDVKKGQDETRTLLDLLHKKKKESNVDELLSPKYIEQYYDSYFFNRRFDMGYLTKINGRNVSLYNLLARQANDAKKSDVLWHPYLGHALKSAGHEFEMIDTDSIGILVPYGHGADLISQLQSSGSNAEKYALLDQTQRFMVNVYENRRKELEKENSLIQLEFNGMLILKEGYYKDDTGLEVNKELKDLFL